jgi:hypothetical protein
MVDKIKMTALMSLPAKGERQAIKRGDTFDAVSVQEGRDLVQMGRAKMADMAKAPRSPEAPARTGK